MFGWVRRKQRFEEDSLELSISPIRELVVADHESVAWIGVDGLVLSVLDEPLAEAHVALSL